jgi:hypothetical protein
MRMPPGCDEEDRVALRALLRETGQAEGEGEGDWEVRRDGVAHVVRDFVQTK